MKLIIGFIITGMLYIVPANATEIKSCSLHKVQEPIKTSSGNIFILKDGKWQLAKK